MILKTGVMWAIWNLKPKCFFRSPLSCSYIDQGCVTCSRISSVYKITPANWAYVANWAYDWLLCMLSLLARWTNNNNSQKYQERSLGSTFSIYPRFSNGSHYSNFAYWCLKLDTETLVSIYFKKITVRVLESETELYLLYSK